jgi:Family of unknown function (DUF6502)
MDPHSTSHTRHAIVLSAVLRMCRPLIRLLLRHGVTYPELTQALKLVFVEVAQEELKLRGMPATDSAVTLLCGVHRKDVRGLTRGSAQPSATLTPDASARPPVSLVGEVVGAWLGQDAWRDADGQPRALQREEFEHMASGVSRDVRPRALMEELLRLGVVERSEAGQLRLLENGFAPRTGLAEMAELMAANLGDHAAAAVANLHGEENFLEQALYVDKLRPEAIEPIRNAARSAWNRALRQVMTETQARWNEDEALTDPADQARRRRRARFGVYFFTQEDPS